MRGMVARNEAESGSASRGLSDLAAGRQHQPVGKFLIGVLIGIVLVIVILVQCTRAIF
jgi:hypothetical protein